MIKPSKELIGTLNWLQRDLQGCLDRALTTPAHKSVCDELSKAVEVAQKLRGHIGRTIGYAIQTGWIEVKENEEVEE